MFVAAIEPVDQFTRPIHSIGRFWGSHRVIPGTSTLFFVNDEGWSLTCAHVARGFQGGPALAKRHDEFRAAKKTLPGGTKHRKALKALGAQFGYKDGEPVETRIQFMNCVNGPLNLEAHFHPSLDLALLKFSGYTELLCTTFPTFAANGSDLKPGVMLCRLGYPFPELSNFEFDEAAQEIRWTEGGKDTTPRFPIDGMVTRHLSDGQRIGGFETGTLGLKGHSVGPAFDAEGRVWGMQAATRHIDLDFDTEVFRGAKKERVQESAVLHVGHCIHIDAMKAFMKEKGVAFKEG